MGNALHDAPWQQIDQSRRSPPASASQSDDDDDYQKSTVQPLVHGHIVGSNAASCKPTLLKVSGLRSIGDRRLSIGRLNGFDVFQIGEELFDGAFYPAV